MESRERGATGGIPGPERFIVGTGRCGSTLLSRMLAEHPGVLSIFEFFTGLDAGRRFDPAPMPGEDFAELIGAEQPFVTAVIRRGYPVEEVLYPYADAARRPEDPTPSGRYRRDDPVPWILVSMLPRLERDCDALFDAAIDYARSLPSQPARDHYRALFDWLARRYGRDLWIERSGSSIDYLEALAASFPDARFLHIHRDGREVALSMRRHHAYRLPISLMYDVVLDTGKRVSESDPLDLYGSPAADDTVSHILASTPSPGAFGRYWSDQMERGAAARSRLATGQLFEIRFEDLVARPRETLVRIRDFFELPDRGPSEARRAGSETGASWIDRASALVRGAPPLRFPDLGPAEREELERACLPGLRRASRAD